MTARIVITVVDSKFGVMPSWLQYDIIGHSGEGYKFDIVKSDKPPKNNKERLDVLKVSD